MTTGFTTEPLFQNNYDLFGQQLVLNHVSALHDQVASGSINFAGFMMLSSKAHHARNGGPHPQISSLAGKKQISFNVLQEAQLNIDSFSILTLARN